MLTPQPPIEFWLTELDAWVQRSQGFFDGKPIVLDLSQVSLAKPEFITLIAELKRRNIPVVAVDGIDSSLLDPDLPPLMSSSRSSEMAKVPDIVPVESQVPAEKHPTNLTSLVIDKPVRSGQSIVCKNGDVTVLGSIASGAEVIAGGSIHIYGTLLGRAMAGVAGNDQARIFCKNFNPELVAIDGTYATVEDAPSHLYGRPVQAWLEQDSLHLRELG
ncbi:MAG: septum site-determining protein MinC [Pseudomonadota bacterium]